MNAFMTSIFGASWRTTLFGLVQLVVGTIINYLQSLEPGASFSWSFVGMQILIAIGTYFQKDKEVHGGTIASGEVPTAKDTQIAVEAVVQKANSKV